MNIIFTTFSQVTQGIQDLYVAGDDLETQISSISLRAVAIAAITLVTLTIIAALLKNHAPKLKLPLFIAMSFTMAFSFLLLAGLTIFLNVSSDSGGPVHWHADTEYWVCGNQLELKNPTATLSNKIGTSTLHEHNDQRIHLEGVVVDNVVDASLGKFMHVIDGAITDNALIVPLNSNTEIFEDDTDIDGDNAPNPDLIADYIVQQGDDRFFRAIDGQMCGDQVADAQVFVYQFNESNNTYAQKKLERPQDYVIRDNSNVPPGDCIIFEFDITKPYTDKICNQYSIRDKDDCIALGIDPSKRSICTNTDATDYDALDAAFQRENPELFEQPDDTTEINTESSAAEEVIIEDPQLQEAN